MELILAFLAWLGLIHRETPVPPPPPPPVAGAARAEEAARDLPEPQPPRTLPPARGCRDALEDGGDVRELPGQVDGEAIHGVAGLERLRAAWGDALIVVNGGDFSRAPFAGRRLRNFCFSSTDFTGSDWREAETDGVGFLHADFTGAWLDRSRMRGLLLDTVKLDGATALGADWRGGMLRGGPMGSLKQVRLDGADLRGFKVDCGGGMDSACLSYRGVVSLRGADLRGAWVDTLCAEIDWAGARLADTRIALRHLPEIGPARRLGTLIVREGDVEARLSPSDYSALQPSVRRDEQSPDHRKGESLSGLGPAQSALFVEAPVLFAPAFEKTPLYRRLVPVLAANPSSRVLVTLRRDGRIDVQGDARGGGDHTCGLEAGGLRLDRATGWYSGPHRAWDSDPAEWRGRPMPVLRFRGDRAEAYAFWHERDPRVSDYITCGARASFGTMVRLPLGSAEARRLGRTELR